MCTRRIVVDEGKRIMFGRWQSVVAVIVALCAVVGAFAPARPA